MIKQRKDIEDIEKQIIRCLFDSDEESLNLQTISKWINSNWLTTLKFCRRLKDIGAIRLIEVQGKTVGAKLNTEAYNLIDGVFRETEKRQPSMFNKWIEDKRIVIVDKNIAEVLGEPQEKEVEGK